MQVMLNKIDDHQAVQLLLKDLVDRNKSLRYDLIVKQIEDKIVTKWLDFVHAHNCWRRPVKCIAKFHLSNKHGLELPDSHFRLSAQIDDIYNDNIDEYVTRIRSVLTDMRYELRNKHDLDRVVFDVVDGREAIDIFEFHDIAKGL